VKLLSVLFIKFVNRSRIREEEIVSVAHVRLCELRVIHNIAIHNATEEEDRCFNSCGVCGKSSVDPGYEGIVTCRR